MNANNKLDQEARVQQMKINARLTALEVSMKLIHAPGYLDPTGGNPANKVDTVTMIANAQMVEQYILGDIERETQRILDELNKPKLDVIKEMPGHLKVRP